MLFSQINVGNIQLPNRIVVSPMCQYSAHKGLMNDSMFHMVDVGTSKNPYIYSGLPVKAVFHLRKQNLDSAKFYAEKAFKNVKTIPRGLPISSHLEENSIMLQVHPTLSIKEIKDISTILRKVLLTYQK